MGIGDLRAKIRKITPLPCVVLNTHYHWDHIGGNILFTESAIHESELPLLLQVPDVGFLRQAMETPAARAALPPAFDPASYRVIARSGGRPAIRTLRDNDLIDLGGCSLRVMHVPGHSPGHVAYLDAVSHTLFTGDSAYLGPVYACFEGSDAEALASSSRRLASLQGVTTICPGHNDIIEDQNWLPEFAQCVEAAVSGRAPGRSREGFIVGREFRFGDLSVWLPP